MGSVLPHPDPLHPASKAPSDWMSGSEWESGASAPRSCLAEVSVPSSVQGDGQSLSPLPSPRNKLRGLCRLQNTNQSGGLLLLAATCCVFRSERS